MFAITDADSWGVVDEGHFADDVSLARCLDNVIADEDVDTPFEHDVHALALLTLAK